MDARAEELFVGIGEIVEEKCAETAFGLFLGLAADEAVDIPGIGVDELTQDVNAQISGGTGEQHIAQVEAFTFAEGIERVELQQIVDSGIVVVRHLVGTGAFGGRAGDQSGQLAGSGIGKDIAVGHMHAGLVGLDDDTGDHERGAAELKEVVGSAHLVHLKDRGKDVAEGAFGIVARSLVGGSHSQLGFGQGLDVGFAVGGGGHFGQLEVGGGHHVLGETARNFGLELVGSDGAVGGIVGA